MERSDRLGSSPGGRGRVRRLASAGHGVHCGEDDRGRTVTVRGVRHDRSGVMVATKRNRKAGLAVNPNVLSPPAHYGRVLKFRHPKPRHAQHDYRYWTDCHGVAVANASRSEMASTPLSTTEGPSCSSAPRTLIVGAGRIVEYVSQAITRHCANRYRVVATMDAQCASRQQTGGRDRGSLQQIVADQNIECVVMALKEWTDEGLLSDLLACKRSGIAICDGLELSERLTGKVYLDDPPLQTLLITAPVRSTAKMSKRCFDMVVALLCLLLTWPLFVVLPLLILLTSTGPVMFRQTRTGLHGRRFTMFKFRSMVQHAEASGVAVWASTKDPRITRIGAFMRRFRLDELPQLINILRGDMGFIGPRPERPEFVEVLEHLNPSYALRHSVKPGLTGWAQVCFRYGASVQDAMEKLAYDLYYLKRQSLVLDCVIVLKTVKTVLAGVGAR